MAVESAQAATRIVRTSSSSVLPDAVARSRNRAITEASSCRMISCAIGVP